MEKSKALLIHACVFASRRNCKCYWISN